MVFMNIAMIFMNRKDVLGILFNYHMNYQIIMKLCSEHESRTTWTIIDIHNKKIKPIEGWGFDSFQDRNFEKFQLLQ